MKKKVIWSVLILLEFISIISMQSCQSPKIRKPSNLVINDFVEAKNIEEQYSLKIDKDNLSYEEKKINAKIIQRQVSAGPGDLAYDEVKLENIRNKISSIESKMKAVNDKIQVQVNDLQVDVPEKQWGNFKNNWRNQKEKLVIVDQNNYLLDHGRLARQFTMDLSDTTSYELALVNQISTTENQSGYFEAQLKCDGDFKFKKSFFTKTIPKNKTVPFRLYENKKNSPKIYIYLNQNVTSCDLYFNNPDNKGVRFGVKLLSNVNAGGVLGEVQKRFEECILPNSNNLKGPEKLFLTPSFNSMTCPEEINDIKTLEMPFAGVEAKAEALLGQSLPQDFVKNSNPYAELDFSKAPKLNAILISYLVFRHDFYGTLLGRLAKWHADHGTQVRIIVSDVLVSKKDKALLNGLVESSNNIKFQEYRYNSDGSNLMDEVNEYHRTMHVKLLITLSDNPADNFVFIGGRNVHDGFVYVKTPDHSAFPELIQYGNKKESDEGFAPWRDYEMRIRSKNLASEIATHYMALWNRDSQSFYVRSINQNIVTSRSVDPKYFEKSKEIALVRHFISIPFKDDDALEKLYIDIFDSAEKTIRLSTPYFRPTKKLGEAMARAVERGVDVTLITRIDLSGDTAAIILSEVNKEGINRFLNKIKIYEYTEPGVILHSKVILIDGKMSIIGSVNLNKRSFVHDMESGVIVYNPEYNKKMNSILDLYYQQAREVTEKQKIALWKRVVIGLLDEEF